MRRLAEKLNSRRGVSILLALLLVLVATMVAAVILSASVTSARRTYDDKELRQQQLSADSAAKLAAECIEHSSVTIVVTPILDEEGEPTGETYTSYLGSGTFGSTLREAVAGFATGVLASTYTKTVSIAPAGKPEMNAELALTVQNTEVYPITGILSVAGGEQKVYLTGSASSGTGVLTWRVNLATEEPDHEEP